MREVLNAVEKAHGKKLNIVEHPRRAGDPPSLIADSSKLKKLFNWQPKYDDLELIVRTALEWERNRHY